MRWLGAVRRATGRCSRSGSPSRCSTPTAEPAGARAALVLAGRSTSRPRSSAARRVLPRRGRHACCTWSQRLRRERATGGSRPFASWRWRRLPPAASLDQFAYRVIAFVFPLWTFTIIAGAIWAENAWGRYWGWDPKETWAFITWVVYAGYLHARATAGWKGRKAAYLALVGFACFLFNYFGVNIFVAGLHSYGGLN